MVSEIISGLNACLKRLPEIKYDPTRAQVEYLAHVFECDSEKRSQPLSHKLTLFDLKTVMEVDQKIANLMKKHLGIEEKIESLNKSFSFDDFLLDAHYLPLMHVTLHEIEVMENLWNSPVWYVLVPDCQIFGRYLFDLADYSGNIGALCTRLRNVEDVPKRIDSKVWFSFPDPEIYTIGNLLACFASNLYSFSSSLPTSALAILSDDQMKDMCFTKLKPEQMDALVCGDRLKDTPSRRFKLLNDEQRNIFLDRSTHLYSQYMKEFFASEESKTFNYTIWNKEQIENVFRTDSSERVSRVPNQQVNEMVRKCPWISEFLSEEQFKVLDVSLLGRKELEKLFPCFESQDVYQLGFNEGRRAARLLNFSEDQIRQMMPRMHPKVKLEAEKHLEKGWYRKSE